MQPLMQILKNKFFHIVILISLPLWPLNTVPVQAEESRHASFEQAGIALEVQGSVSRQLEDFISAEVIRLRRHWIFKERLPSPVGILLDQKWEKSAGFSSPDLKTSKGYPAILINPQRVSTRQEWKRILAHEFSHLVHRQARPHETSWVIEGVGLLAEHLLSEQKLFHPGLAHSYRDPETSLIGDLNVLSPSYNGKDKLPQYGHLLQYFYYIHRLCGGDVLLHTLLFNESKSAGIEFIDRVLKALTQAKVTESEACSDFNTSFEKFQLARFKNDQHITDGFVRRSLIPTAVRTTARKLTLPYSATAYYKPDHGCAQGDHLWGERKCIRIRFE